MDIDKLLASTKVSMEQYKKEQETDKFSPRREIFWHQFLVPVDATGPFPVFNNWYLGDDPSLIIFNYEVIIHYHKEDDFCAAPKFCHIYGFWPDGNYGRKFREIFSHLWEPVYKKNGWTIPQ